MIEDIIGIVVIVALLIVCSGILPVIGGCIPFTDER